MSFEV